MATPCISRILKKPVMCMKPQSVQKSFSQIQTIRNGMWSFITTQAILRGLMGIRDQLAKKLLKVA